MARNDFQCPSCEAVEERSETVADIDSCKPQYCKCGAVMHRLPPLVSDNPYCGQFHSFDSMTFEQRITSKTQLDSLRKQYGLKPVERDKKKEAIPHCGTIYSYKGQKQKDSRAHGAYVRPR
jgi:hypothetical protein